MVLKRRNRKILFTLILSDVVFTVLSFLLAYEIRFHFGIFNVGKGIPPIEQYLKLTPFLAIIWIIVFSILGLYRSRRGKSPIDEFFSLMPSYGNFAHIKILEFKKI